jgi:predicted MPP superfamily phosphohydrolase
MRMLIFFTIVIVVFGSLGYYLYHRISNTFSGTFLASKTFLFIYVFLIASFFIGKTIEHYNINWFSINLIRLGSYVIGVFFYAILAFAFFDILNLISKVIPIYPSFIKENISQVRFYTSTAAALIVLLTVIYGSYNSFIPRVQNLDLQIDKKVDGLESLNVVAVSDIHLGTMVNKIKVKKLVDKINALNPDLVIIAGDIIDDNIKAVKKYGLIEYFNELNPKYGVHGIMGNHEYIGRSYSDIPYYENNNINMIIDSVELIDDKFYIAGRDDLQAKAFFNRDRKDMPSLLNGLDKSKPVILMDHQPFNLEKSQQEGVDFHFSGHTHHGQFWPLNYITGALFEQDWGYLKKGDTHFYISCGYGTALVPFRIGSHPEIVSVKMNFSK